MNGWKVPFFNATVFGPDDCHSRAFQREEDARAWAKETVASEIAFRKAWGKSVNPKRWVIEVRAETLCVY